jgi:hypothetical protein
MKKKSFIRIGFMLFLLLIGYLVGAGLGKTVKYLSGKQEKSPAVLFHSYSSNNC